MMRQDAGGGISDLLLARYEEGGRGPDSYDCFGLFAELCRRRGLEIPEHPSPDDTQQRETEILREAAAHWQRLAAPEQGCAVLIRIGPYVSHLGMMLANRKFIHANRKTGITISGLDDVLWLRRIAGFYRWGNHA